jgi:DNA-binding NarL/FixJ family response regulator
VLFLDEYLNLFHLREALRAEAAGYWTKQASFEQLLFAVRAVAAGQRSFAPEAAAMLRTSSRDRRPEPALSLPPEWPKLSRREFEVFICLAHGLDLRECADRLALSVNTVDNHKTRLMRKLGVHRSVDLVLLAARHGLLGGNSAPPRGLMANLDQPQRPLGKSGQPHVLSRL